MRTSTSGSQANQPGMRYAQSRSHRPSLVARLSREQYGMVLEYQQLWNRLALRLLRSQGRATPFVVGVTSSMQGEGKTTASIGLAVALAQESLENVALIEANFHNPTLAQDFGVEREPGLIDYVTGRRPLLDVSKATSVDRLTLFAVGNLRPSARGLTPGSLNGHLRHQLQEVVRQLDQEFPYIVLDLPPILGNVDTEEMLRFVHGTILVVRTGVTPLEKLRQATQRLEQRQLLGVVHLGDQTQIPRWVSRLISD